MPSTYTSNKIYELQATGENAGTWGVLLNAVLSIIDLNLGGRLALNVAGAADITLTTTQERNAYILMTGLLTGNINLIFTATNGGFYLIDNRSTGSFTVTAKPSGGTGVIIPQNAKCLVMIDPDNTRAVICGTPDILTTQGDILYRDASGVQRLAAGTAGQFLKTLGAGANPVWGGDCFRAYKSGSQSAGTDTDVTFDTEEFDIGSHFAGSAWTPSTGKAIIGCSLNCVNVASGITCGIRLKENGSVIRSYTIQAPGATFTMNFVTIVDADGSDAYSINAIGDSSWTISSGVTSSEFWGMQI